MSCSACITLKIKVPKNVNNMYNSEEYIKYRGKKPNINTGQDSGNIDICKCN
jgi:hypothetical protein